MADTNPPIMVGSPQQASPQYDATLPDGSALGGWVKARSGPCDMNGVITGDWPSSDGWQQT
jgi:hypothetical protein